MFLVGFLLLAAPVLFVAFLALAVDVTATKSRERKAADEVVRAKPPMDLWATRAS